MKNLIIPIDHLVMLAELDDPKIRRYFFECLI